MLRDCTKGITLRFFVVYPWIFAGAEVNITAQTKGWWALRCQPKSDALASSVGWVATGCLLETNTPIASTCSASSSPIDPEAIRSASKKTVAVVDYEPRHTTPHDLALKRGVCVRVFKHKDSFSYVMYRSRSKFSYISDLGRLQAIKEGTGQRGWVG
jgi:hypothetical protein